MINRKKKTFREQFEEKYPELLRQLEERGDHCDDPFCPCHRFRRPCPAPNQPCSLTTPLWMVIPAEGIHISCPVHGKHFIPGNRVTCSAQGPMWRATA